MKKSLLVTLSFVAMIIISFAFTRDDPKYKNLKILPKDISKDQIDSVMHHFSLSLGVKCNFCHLRNDSTKTWDFASDNNKHKLAARGMMTMMQKINDKYFDVAGAKGLDAKLLVTCYTCHHGSTDPATKPPRLQQQQSSQTDSTKRNQ